MLQKSIIPNKRLLSQNTLKKMGVLIICTSKDHFTSAMQVAIKKHYVPKLQCNFHAGNFVVC